MSHDFDVCVIGSGAGGGPVAFELSKAGYRVLVLEKGRWFGEKDFYKDELACCRRGAYTPNLKNERHVIEEPDNDGWSATSTYDSGWSFWNGNCVGGATNFMSGFFHRLKPTDFKLLSTYGAIQGANTVDWPIAYSDLEPYYAKVEREVGISGRVVSHPFLEPRSTPQFPMPPTLEHPVANWIDQTGQAMGLHPLPVARAILSQPKEGRQSCSYSGYCGSYGCSTGAKGSSRASLLDRAVATGRCQIWPESKVERIASDRSGKISHVEYFSADGILKKVNASIYVVACQAIETSRLLLYSIGSAWPQGLANRYGQLGKNLVFSAGGTGTGELLYHDFDDLQQKQLAIRGPFVNRALQDFYEINDLDFGAKSKGGTIEFLFSHPNPIRRATSQKWQGGQLIWGKPLKRAIERYFSQGRYLRFEVFNDWLPNDQCFVSLDHREKDQWGTPVAKVRVGYHPHDLKVARYLTQKGKDLLLQTGAKNVSTGVSGSPPANLVAGGCRFGLDPESAVLDSDCRAFDVDNLFVTDGSFMPTGGSVPYTWTIYANAFRVADKIISQLGGSKGL